jgi:hypothetical protein
VFVPVFLSFLASARRVPNRNRQIARAWGMSRSPSITACRTVRSIGWYCRRREMNMTDEPITPGATINNWLVASVNGRAATCQCKCGSLRVISIASLLDRTAAPSCGCAPPSRGQAAQQRTEAGRQRDLRGWRPQYERPPRRRTAPGEDLG